MIIKRTGVANIKRPWGTLKKYLIKTQSKKNRKLLIKRTVQFYSIIRVHLTYRMERITVKKQALALPGMVQFDPHFVLGSCNH